MSRQSAQAAAPGWRVWAIAGKGFDDSSRNQMKTIPCLTHSACHWEQDNLPVCDSCTPQLRCHTEQASFQHLATPWQDSIAAHFPVHPLVYCHPPLKHDKPGTDDGASPDGHV